MIYSYFLQGQTKTRCQLIILLMLLTLVLAVPIAHASTPATPAQIELQQAIKKLTARAGPPGAYRENLVDSQPLSLIQHSLWQRLRNNFEFASLEHSTVDAQLDFMQKGLQSLTSNLRDSSSFLFFIVDEIDRAGLPLDIALLPLVESAFDPLATSNQHAAGLWQFIPATADLYGLQRNQWYDGRNDIIDSTHAAIRYLKKLHKVFDGDWLLALAAYNTGPGNVRKAMRKAVDNGLEPSFWNLRLAKETRDYVPRLIAVNKMISNPESYGLNLPELHNSKQIDTVAIGRPLSFDVAADFAGISTTRLRALNPGHLQGTIPPGGPYHLTVPVGTSQQLLTELSTRKLNLSDDTPLSLVVSQADFQRTHLSSSPGSQFTTSFNTESKKTRKPYKKYVYKSHIVQPGDNLWELSRAMNTSVDTLMEWNRKSENSVKLQPGDRMIVAYLDEDAEDQVKQKLIHYRVTASDTLFTITDRFSLSISELKRWNPALWKKNSLQTGQAIKIPIQTSSGF